MNSFEESMRIGAETRLNGILPEILKTGLTLVEMQTGDLSIKFKSNDSDLVTKADFFSEKSLTDWIRANHPDDGILAEEGSRIDSKAGSGNYLWVIDPVDGTVNYAHRLPLYAISVGLMCENEIAGGIVHLPALSSTYRAVRGCGATKNGNSIFVSKTAELQRGLVVTGFPYNRGDILDPLLSGIGAVLQNARGFRRTGSAALDLCWVAEGLFDALYEVNLNPWDTCAGVALVREAGGSVSDLRGNTYDLFEKTILAGNSLVNEQLVRILRPMAEGFENMKRA